MFAVVALLLLQDNPKISLDVKDREFGAVIEEINRQARCSVPVDAAVRDRKVTLSLKDAAFFEAIDAACRAHGDATYFRLSRREAWDDEKKFQIASGGLADLPSSYSGTFKVVVWGMQEVRALTLSGEHAAVHVGIAIFAASEFPLEWDQGSKVVWTVSEARDGEHRPLSFEGKADLRESRYERYRASPELEFQSNACGSTLMFGRFDIDRGLALLKGKVELQVPATVEVEVPLVAGTSVEVPQGKVLVEGIHEYQKSSAGTQYRITLSFESAKKTSFLELDKVFQKRISIDGEKPSYTSFNGLKNTFEVETSWLDGPPKKITLYCFGRKQKLTVPFELKNVRFKKD